MKNERTTMNTAERGKGSTMGKMGGTAYGMKHGKMGTTNFKSNNQCKRAGTKDSREVQHE